MLRIKEETVIVNTIEDTRSLSHAELTYLVSAGCHEFFKDEEYLKKYDLFALGTMNKLNMGMFDHYISTCHQDDKYVSIEIPEVGFMDVCPVKEGIEIIYQDINAKIIYSTCFDINFLIDNLSA